MKKLQYRYRTEDLSTGSSLGNRYLFARLDARTDLQGLWCSGENRFVVGEWSVSIYAGDAELVAEETLFSPESQATHLGKGVCQAEKLFFLPFVPDDAPGQATDLSGGAYIITLRNAGSKECVFRVTHTLLFPALPTPLFTKHPSPEDSETRVVIKREELGFVVATVGRPHETRVIREPVPPEHWKGDNRSLRAEYLFSVPPGETREVPFSIGISSIGAADAAQPADRLYEARAALSESIDGIEEVLARTHIVTPDPLINRGLQWSKVNTVRVQHLFKAGKGFTNDPPQDIVVVRDVAWYVMGSDYLTPRFSRGVLELVLQTCLHDGGKLTEYIHAAEATPVLHDYNLNINDDTPLFILALIHYAASTGDMAFLRLEYPALRGAAEWIIAQVHEGLVRCSATGTGVWGICGWRNIIEGYTLSGAVTEINAECAAALSLLAAAATALGHNADAARFQSAAGELTENINRTLRSERTGMYLLNLTNERERRHDVTGDLIFPVMFGIAPADVRARILTVLTSPDFWTPFGLRTVSPREANYDPDAGYQLVGGVWPNLMAWTAFCVRKDDPQKLADAMRSTYCIAQTPRPRDYVNVVPGEFPERLHGESFVSRGMTMSPWMPPTYLWLGVEGMLGVNVTLTDLEITPVIPPEWRWIAVENLLVKGERVNAFLHDGILYSSHAVKSGFPLTVGVPVPVSVDNPSLIALALRVHDEIVLFVASDESAAGRVTVEAGTVTLQEGVSLQAGGAALYRYSAESSASRSSFPVAART